MANKDGPLGPGPAGAGRADDFGGGGSVVTSSTVDGRACGIDPFFAGRDWIVQVGRSAHTG